MKNNKPAIQLTTRTFILMVLFGYLFLADIGFCQWSNDPSENNVLAWGLYVPVIISDMQNGVIVAGQTHWAYAVIYAQRMSVDGRRLWPGDSGVKITDSPYRQGILEYDKEFGMSDGAGGCYIAYHIRRLAGYTSGPDPSEYYDTGLYVQRLDPSGNRLFGPNGLALMPDEKDSTGYHQQMQYWCADGYGGLYAIFERAAYEIEPERDGVYLTRISGSGEILWGPKRVSRGFIKYFPYLDSDYNLNSYCYPGETIPKTPDKFIKINPETGEIISEKEIEIGVGEYGFTGINDYCTSDNYSAIFAFNDFWGDTLRIQKIDANGNNLWGDEPVIIDHGNGEYLGFDVESDQRGGAYILYVIPIYNVPQSLDSVYLAHLDQQGHRLWDRTFYSSGWGAPYNEMISVAGDGNVFVLTEQMKYLTKLSFEGEILWRTMVTSRDTIIYSSSYSGLIADSLGGCIVVWHEIGYEFCGFMAQRVDQNGNLGGPTSVWSYSSHSFSNNNEITSVYPNPFNDAATIRFSIYNSQQITLKVFNILGKEVVTIQSGNLTGGDHVINWQGTDRNGQVLASGVYWLVLQTGSTRVSQKLLILR
jgi:hypothetical protein